MDNTLTSQDITSLNLVFGGNVNPSNPSAGPSRADQIRALAKGSSGTFTNPFSTVADTIKSQKGGDTEKSSNSGIQINKGLGLDLGGAGVGALDLTKPILDTGKGIWDKVKEGWDEIKNAGARSATGEQNPLSAGVDMALGGSKALAAPVTETIGKGIGAVANPILKPFIDQINNSDAVKAFTDVMSKHPQIADTLSKLLETGMNMTAVEGTLKAPEAIKEGVPKIQEGVSNLKENISSKISGTPEEVVAKQTQSSIDAVNPDLTGKKLTSAYKQVVTGQREATPASVFQEQGLTPDKQTINLGTRLQDLNLGKDHIQNLDTLGKALGDTETKLSSELKQNPNIDIKKGTLLDNLDKGTTEALPREFKGIKDATTAFENVINYAKELVNKTPDNYEQLRNTATEFDNQVKTEYPNAFKDGKVNTATPSGRAIKYARDTIRQHIYDTAPNGSEIQKLVGREADIFRATENIAPKASAGEGLNKVQQTIKNHPNISNLLKYGGGLFIGEKALKMLGVPFML